MGEVAPPIELPFNSHWYDGLLPPFVGVAVNVTAVPLQMLLPVEPILTDAGTVPSVMVTAGLVPVELVTQERLLVKTTLTWSLLASVLVV